MFSGCSNCFDTTCEEQKRMEEYVIINCNNCKSKLRVPGNRGRIRVTCPVCKHQFSYSGTFENIPKATFDTPPQQNQSSRQPANTAFEQPTQACRTLTVARLKHAHTGLDVYGLRNKLLDNISVSILLDGVKQGVLSNNGKLELHIDSREHRLASAILGSSYKIPAGNESYLALFFNNAFQIAPLEDPFRDRLMEFLLRIVRGQGFKERILNPNNRTHAVEINLTSNYIEIFMHLDKPKGLVQLVTGGQSEKIYYKDVGLVPPNEDRRPGGYWDYLKTYMRETVENDSEADLVHAAGGFTIRTTHKLY